MKPQAFAAVLRSKAPTARIARLRRHTELNARADELDAWLAELHGRANAALCAAIADSEYRALALDTAPAVVERRHRAQAQEKVSTQRIINALRSFPTQAEAAATLGIDERQIRNRVPRAERERIKNEKRKS